jgi:hypothetical protein
MTDKTKEVSLNLLYSEQLMALFIQKFLDATEDEIPLLDLIADEMVRRMVEYDGTVNKAINLLYKKCGEDVEIHLAKVKARP